MLQSNVPKGSLQLLILSPLYPFLSPILILTGGLIRSRLKRDTFLHIQIGLRHASTTLRLYAISFSLCKCFRILTLMQGNGYWYQPGFTFLGSFTIAASKFYVFPTPEQCAAECDKIQGCTAFMYSVNSQTCIHLLAKVEGMCDLSTAECLNNPLRPPTRFDYSSNSALCNTCLLYILDIDHMYCAPNSNTCAGAREYYQCMQSWGCANSAGDLSAHREVCRSSGCTAVQCGLSTVDCNTTAIVCAQTFSTCMIESQGSCTCTKSFLQCMTDANCNIKVASSASGYSAESMCVL